MKRRQNDLSFEEIIIRLLKNYRKFIGWLIIAMIFVFIYLQISVLPNLNEQIVGVTDEEKENVNTYLKYEELLKGINDYIQNSARVKCDPYNCYTLHIVLKVNDENINIRALKKEIDGLFEEPDLQDTLLGLDSPKYLKEILSVEYSVQESDRSYFITIDLVFYEENSLVEVDDLINEKFSDLKDCSFEKIQDEILSIVDPEMAFWQKDIYDFKNNCNNQCEVIWSNLSEKEKALYRQAITGQLEETETVIIPPDNINQLEYYLIGVLFAVLIYVSVEIFVLSFSGRVQNGLELECSTDIICEIINSKANNPLDKLIRKLEHRILPSPTREILNKDIKAFLLNYQEKYKIEKFQFISIGEKAEYEIAKSDIGDENLVNNLYKNDLNLDDFDKVILIIKYNSTFYDEFQKVMRRCSEKDLLLGVIAYC